MRRSDSIRAHTAFYSLILIGAFMSLQPVYGDTAVLNPGELSGTVTLSGETVTGGTAWADSTIGGFNASSNFSGNTYALTVEGGYSYRAHIRATIDNGGPYTNIEVYLPNSTALLVPVGGSEVQDFQYDTARISGTIAVIGGSVQYYSLNASAYENGETYRAGASYSGAQASGAFSFPMILDGSVSVSGQVRILTSGGSTVYIPLAGKSISLGSSGSSLSWSIDLSSTGVMSGAAEVNNPIGADIVATNRIYLQGQGGTPTSGIRTDTFIYGNGDYTVQDLTPGSYYTWLQSNFSAPYGDLRSPTASVEIVAGEVTNKDFFADLGFLRGTFDLTGFVDSSKINWGYILAGGVSGSPTSGASATDYVYAGGAFDLALSEGAWMPYYTYLFLSDSSDPGHPLNVRLQRSDSSKHNPYYGGIPIQMNPGDDLILNEVSFTTAETKVIFDVAEAGGAEINISAPYITGYSLIYDETGRTVGSRQFQAYGPSTAQPKPEVRIVGEPGTYSISAFATVNGTRTEFATFDLTLLEPVNTPAGNVIINPSETLSMEFENVIEGGITTVTESPIGPEIPSGFKMLAPGEDPVYYDITTTAVFEGFVEISINYRDTDDQGNYLFTGNKEKNLKLFHYDESVSRWVDITSSSTADAPNPDTVNNIIRGVTESFSVFAILIPENVEPSEASIQVSPNPAAVGASVTAMLQFEDPDFFDTHTVEWTWGDGSSSLVSLPTGDRTVEGGHVYGVPGFYTIAATVSDDFGSTTVSSEKIVVYDPEGGFVTGGGWIQSPEGAYPVDPARSGRSNFGFQVKYKKGTTVPAGETEFQFQAGGLNFHASGYDWLVLTGPQAWFKGTGTINEQGNFGFMITMIDGQSFDGGGVDRIRIQIWDPENGDAILYDTQPGDGIESAPMLSVGGGSLQLHRR